METAAANRIVDQAVARHKAIFFAEKNSYGEAINYKAVVSGKLRLVPSDEALKTLSLDYSRMVDDGLLLDEAEPFEELLDQRREVQERVNRRSSHNT